MYFQFLIEDPSGRILVERVMEKIKAVHPGMEYSCKSFHGIGGFTRRNTVKETKDGSAKLKKDGQSYRSIGTVKCEWAGNIGEFLDIHKNRSPSFQYFVGEIEKRLSGARS